MCLAHGFIPNKLRGPAANHHRIVLYCIVRLFAVTVITEIAHSITIETSK